MFKKILVPTDFTDEADRVLTFAKGLRKFGVTEITLIHIIDIDRAVIWPLPPTIVDAIGERLEGRREDLEREGFIARTILVEGDPSVEIIRAAEAGDYSMIVTGSHGKRLIEEILLGSVSEAISRGSKIPVLLIRYDVLKDIERKMSLTLYAEEIFREVLFLSDFSEASERVLKVIGGIGKPNIKKVTALHIVDTKRVETEQEKKELMDICDTQCDKISKELKKKKFKVESICRTGDPLAEILSVAGSIDASLIVMGSHSKSVVKEWLVGSVSLNVIRTADRPALIVYE